MRHRNQYCFFCILISLLFAVNAVFSQSWEDDEYRYRAEMRRKAEQRYLPRHSDLRVHRYYDHTVIERSTIINGHVLVDAHDLRIHGIVRGCVLVLDGDVTIAGGAIVEGDVTSVSGHVYLADGATVRGNMLETQRDFISRQRERIRSYYRFTWNPYRDKSTWYRMEEGPGEENLLLRYNRVDGGFLGLQLPQEYHRQVYLSPYGFVGYGFESRKLRYMAGLDRPMLHSRSSALVFGGEIHDLLDTQDDWRVDYTENSLAAFFLKTDYHDYFRKTGYSVHLTHLWLPFVRTSVAWRHDDYRTATANTDWALFRTKENFRSNPALGEYEGNMRSIFASLRIDTRNRKECPTRGILAEWNSEFSDPGFGGDFDFRRHLLSFTLHQPLTYGENLMLRAMAGTSDGNLPLQKRFELGGIGSLRGYNYKEFSGSRMFLASAEYRLTPDLLDDWFGLDGIQFVLFGDAGDAWNGSSDDNIVQSMRPLRLDRLKSSLGFGFGDEDGTIRLEFAKRTDRDAKLVTTLRLQHPF